MNFWKDHRQLRVILIAVFFVVGLALTLVGWRMTGQLAGLGLMLVGVILLLAAMFVYNDIYAEHKKGNTGKGR